MSAGRAYAAQILGGKDDGAIVAVRPDLVARGFMLRPYVERPAFLGEVENEPQDLGVRHEKWLIIKHRSLDHRASHFMVEEGMYERLCK